ncbi:MAG: ribonuclease PH, partial [Alphaproteobacteria bacterium]|nr:ribonuclease PH [Alphaproteobacteria bacterium]
ASITGAWVALRIACERLLVAGAITKMPLTGQVAAISCGIYQGQAVLDLDYDEDSAAEIDANFILTADGELVEVQATGEAHPFTRASLNEMLDLAETGCNSLFELQRRAFQDAGF